LQNYCYSSFLNSITQSIIDKIKAVLNQSGYELENRSSVSSGNCDATKLNFIL